MKIEFDPYDLKLKYINRIDNDQKISTREVTYNHLNKKAQKVLDIVGRGVFFAWDRQTYNAVWSPKVK